MEINQIINIDCVEGMKEIPNNTIPLTVCSPPYQNLRTYNGYKFDFFAAAQELYRITSNGGVICWIIGDSIENNSETLEPFRQAITFKSLGFNIHDTMIYQKKNFSHPEKNRYHQIFEYVFVISKGKPKIFNPIIDRKNLTAGSIGNLGINTFTEKDGSKSFRKKQITAEFGKRYNVWLGNTRGQEEMCIELKHPGMMPKWLARDLIISFSNPNDLVFDPLVGSGTVCEEAKKLGRNYLGFDSNPEYVKLAQDNLNNI